MNKRAPAQFRVKAFTDYPFEELGDDMEKNGPIREITVLSFDGDKRCEIECNGVKQTIKSGYIFKAGGGSLTKNELARLIPDPTRRVLYVRGYLCDRFAEEFSYFKGKAKKSNLEAAKCLGIDESDADDLDTSYIYENKVFKNLFELCGLLKCGIQIKLIPLNEMVDDVFCQGGA